LISLVDKRILLKKQPDLLFKIEQNTLLIDIATCNVAHLLPDDSVGDAAGIMANMQISSVVVTDLDGHPLGIVTERDMLQAMRSVCPPETALRKIMSAPVITLPESITCLQAYQICRRNGIRHLVIVNHDQQVVGVVSETDFRMHINLSALAGHRQVGAVMRQAEFCLPPDASVADALNLMQTHSETCVLITDAGRPIGIITERDIVKLYSSKLDIIDMPVIDVMTTSVLTIPLNSSINNAAELMLTAKLRHLIVVDQSNRTVGLISEHDLTENLLSRQIDEKLVTDSAFLHILINTLPDMVWLKDANGVYLACNQRFEAFFGAKQADIVGKTDYDFVEEDLANFFRAHDVKAMENNSLSINEEWVTFADDGHQELLETTKTIMHDSQGKLIGVLGIAHDITKRKKNEQLLRLSEEKYRSLVQNIPGVVWTADQTGKIIFISDNASNILGYFPKEIYAEPNLWFNIIHADDVDSVKTQFFDLFKSNQILDIEFRIKRKDGEWIWIHDRSFVTYIDGGIRFADGLFTDITQSKKAETALAESEGRYRALFENSPFCIHEVKSPPAKPGAY
jgi:PAS domain S-box-containing protein